MKTGPSQKEFLGILNVPSPKLFVEHKNLYKRLAAGEMGEQEVLRYFKDYGKRHWHYIQNYWANSNGIAESDLIVFTDTSCYVIEVRKLYRKI